MAITHKATLKRIFRMVKIRNGQICHVGGCPWGIGDRLTFPPSDEKHKALFDFGEASVELALKGGGHPKDRAGIEADYKDALLKMKVILGLD